MMSEEEQQQVLEACKYYMRMKDYDAALELLEPFECILATWLKGKIYRHVADQMANLFSFKYYGNDKQKQHHRDILTSSHDLLCQTASTYCAVSPALQAEIVMTLWYDIGHVENELARTKPMPKEKTEDCDYEGDEFKDNEKHHIQSMVDQIEFWTLDQEV